MSSIGAMSAPHHELVADELVRVCRPGGTIGLLSWTPEGMIGQLLRTMGPFAPAPPRPARNRRRCGAARSTSADCSATAPHYRPSSAIRWRVTAFEHPRDYGEHFKARYGPTISARANAARSDRAAAFDRTLDAFCHEWNRGTEEDARFELEYLVLVGTRM